MKKFNKNRIIKIITIIISVIIINLNVFATPMILPNGRDAFISLEPVISSVVVAGDSYAQHFCMDEQNDDIRFIAYAKAGVTVRDNKDILMKAFDSLNKIVLFSIGVNDHIKDVHPEDFRKSLREILDKGVETKKIVFIHSYMNYPIASILAKQFTPSVYDNVIRDLTNEYDNTYYIDMNDCMTPDYFMQDGIHCNKKFNDVLHERLLIYFDILKEYDRFK